MKQQCQNHFRCLTNPLRKTLSFSGNATFWYIQVPLTILRHVGIVSILNTVCMKWTCLTSFNNSDTRCSPFRHPCCFKIVMFMLTVISNWQAVLYFLYKYSALLNSLHYMSSPDNQDNMYNTVHTVYKYYWFNILF